MKLKPYFKEFTERDWQTIADGEPVRLAIIGLGGFARSRALPAIEQSLFCETTVVVSGSPEKANHVASAFDIEQVINYEDFRDGAAAGAYDAVYIATPNALHLGYTKTAAELGKHVLCEKPLEISTNRVERMVRICEEADVVLMTAYRLRTEPAVRRMREMIRDGVIGNPVQIHSGFSSRLLDAVGSDTWRLDPELAGGGALIDIGIYPLNTSRFLLDADPITIQATTHSTQEMFNAVDEHVAFQLTFPEDVTASCTASFNAYPDSRIHVIGTEGQLQIDSPFGGDVPQHITVERGEMSTEHTGPPVDEVVEEFDYFAHCILTDAPCESSGEDGLKDVRIIEAAYDSAESGTRINLR